MDLHNTSRKGLPDPSTLLLPAACAWQLVHGSSPTMVLQEVPLKLRAWFICPYSRTVSLPRVLSLINRKQVSATKHVMLVSCHIVIKARVGPFLPVPATW